MQPGDVAQLDKDLKLNGAWSVMAGSTSARSMIEAAAA